MKKDSNVSNWPLIGNGHIIDFLTKSVANDNLAGFYIFYGPDNLGKRAAASFFSKILLCQNKQKNNLPCGQCTSCLKFNVYDSREEGLDLSGAHSDLYIIKKEKDKKNISIEQTREFIRKLSMSSFLDSYKIGIIQHAHELSASGANALLKTLEEPKDKVIIILTTSKIDAIPATIVSRSQVLKFNLVKAGKIYDYLVKEKQAPRSSAKNFSHMSLGRPALAVKFLEDKEFYNSYLEKMNAFLRFFNKDINSRIQAVDELIGKEGGQESARLASRIIEIWLGLARDLLMIEFNHGDLIQHKLVAKELLASKARFKAGGLLNLAFRLQEARKYLAANVNPRLVLENIVVNI